MKKVLIFLSVFAFIQICQIYIVGGFYCQTITSKSLAIYWGFFIGVGAAVMLDDK
jgi:hypothetical protein